MTFRLFAIFLVAIVMGACTNTISHTSINTELKNTEIFKTSYLFAYERGHSRVLNAIEEGNCRKFFRYLKKMRSASVHSYWYARMHETGSCVEKNKHIAFMLVRDDVRHNEYSQLELRLATYYDNGFGTFQSKDKARILYRKYLEELGPTYSTDRLIEEYVEVNPHTIGFSKSVILEEEVQRLEVLKHGTAEDHYQLGLKILSNYGSKTRAFNWMQTAAQMGHIEAFVLAIDLRFQNMGGFEYEFNINNAAKKLSELIDTGHLNAINLGIKLYETNPIVRKNQTSLSKLKQRKSVVSNMNKSELENLKPLKIHFSLKCKTVPKASPWDTDRCIRNVFSTERERLRIEKRRLKESQSNKTEGTSS